MNIGKILMQGAAGRYHADPYIGSVKSLLHFDGANNSTTFTDELGHTWTGAGNAKISTGQSLSGGSSLLLDGTGDFLTGDGSADFAFGTGDFTLEMFVNMANITPAQALIDTRASGDGTGNDRLMLALINSGGARWALFSGGAWRITGTVAPTATAWIHLAIARQSSAIRLFAGGTKQGSDWTSVTANFGVGASRPIIGCNGNSAGDYANCSIEDIRVTKGDARYWADFTPPTPPFANP